MTASSSSFPQSGNLNPENKEGIRADQLFWKPKTASRPILDEISASFHPGKFYALIGPNGAGKTSFLRCLPAFIRPNRGKVFLGGEAISTLSRKSIARFLAYLPQDSDERPKLPVKDIIAMARYPWHTRFSDLGSSDYELIDRAIQLCHCQDLQNRDYSELSGGERQRILCCRAIAQQSPWILLDEPISNLDLHYQHEILQILRELVDQKMVSVIAVMHDLSLSWHYVDEVCFIHEGRLLASGRKEEVLCEEVLRKVYGEGLKTFDDPGSGERFFTIQKQASQVPQT